MDSPSGHIPASPGPYSNGGENGPAGPAAVIQLSNGHFLITMSVVTTFPPSAVLPTIYALLPQAQLQCDHIDLQIDEAAHKLRVQLVGVTPLNNPNAVANLAARLKSLQPGATVVARASLSQLSVDADSIAAVSSLLMSSQSRALLDQHVHYYRLHSHPSFIPQLLIYIETKRVEHVLNIMRNFMADPTAGGAVKPPRPSGLDIKGDAVIIEQAAPAAAAAAPATPEKEKAAAAGSGLPAHRGVPSSASSRSPHFKAKTMSSGSLAAAGMAGLGLPPASAHLEPQISATSATANVLQGFALSNQSTSTSSTGSVSAASASSSAAGAAPAGAAAATDSHGPSAPLATSVSETTPIRIDNKWWSSKRAELLRLLTQHSMSHDALYVYSLSALADNIKALKGLSSIDRVFYACKANHHEVLLRAIEAAGFGFECVSIQELKFIHALFPNLGRERLLFTPNFAPKLEYEEAYFYTDYVNLDNLYALDTWPEIFKNKPVMVRLDPGEGLGYHEKMQTGGARSKFGVSVQQMTQALPKINALGIKVIGLHVHKGSGIHDAGVWARTATFLASFIQNFPHLRILDLGGGLGVSYKDTDPLLDLNKLDKDLADFRSALPEGMGAKGTGKLELWLEPGRFMVANTGVLLTSVTQLKSKPGRSFVGVTTGMNSLLRPALYESHHDIVNLSRLPEHSQQAAEAGKVYLNTLDPRSHSLVDVVGPICESGDVLGHARSLPTNTTEGDVILIDTVGAYGRVMSSEYNMRPPAFEIAME